MDQHLVVPGPVQSPDPHIFKATGADLYPARFRLHIQRLAE
jgi:hypothetical protein